jgi:hypothetical protein
MLRYIHQYDIHTAHTHTHTCIIVVIKVGRVIVYLHERELAYFLYDFHLFVFNISLSLFCVMIDGEYTNQNKHNIGNTIMNGELLVDMGQCWRSVVCMCMMIIGGYILSIAY